MNVILYLSPESSFKIAINSIKNLVQSRSINKISVISRHKLSFLVFLINIYLYLQKTTTDNSAVLVASFKDNLILRDLLKSLATSQHASAAFYGDSLIETPQTTWYEARPVWSPFFLTQHDYLGNVLAFKSPRDTFYEINKSTSRMEIKDLLNKFTTIERIDCAIAWKKVQNFKTHNSCNKNDDSNFREITQEGLPTCSPPAAISLIIPTNFQKINTSILIYELLDSLKTWSSQFRMTVTLVLDESKEFAFFELDKLYSSWFNFRKIITNGPFNFSKAMNLGAKEAQEEVIFFINDDLIFNKNLNFKKITKLLENNIIGAIGIKLLYQNEKIQHAGIEYRDKEPQHFLKGSEKKFLSLAHSSLREVSGVTAAFVAIKRDYFLDLGGFDENLPLDYNDVDLMLRVHKSGKCVLMDGSSFAYHQESASRGTSDKKSLQRDLEYVKKKHGDLPARDPYLYTPFMQ